MTLRLMRREPIDLADICEQTGLSAGKICKTAFGWGVQNTRGLDGPNVALFDEPPFREGETDLRIDGKDWVFYGPEGDSENGN